jgi:ABC-type multidrug transport system fused ATPase/permease subunit
VPFVPFADISFGELLLLVVEVFLFVIWIWILFTIITDLFRDHELSGWWKAVWVLFLVFIPFLTALVYLIARGSGMRDRTIKAQAEAKQHFDDYVRQQAHTTPADELHKLNELREKGALSEEEFQRAKDKLLA